MIARSTFKVALLCAVLLATVVSVVAVQTQRRKRPSRRATTPVSPTYVPAPSPAPSGEPRLVSTAEDQAQEESRTSRASRNRAKETAEDAEARKELELLSTELKQLNSKVSQMERQRRVDLIQERLTRAEQRAEGLQAQLRDVLEKEANLQARSDQLDEQMRPENLDRQIAVVGTFRPDEARDSLRRQLENEKKRVRAQLDLQAASRTRLEASLTAADQIVERLRTELEEASRREAEGDAGTETTTAPSSTPRRTPNPNPSPTPTPPI